MKMYLLVKRHKGKKKYFYTLHLMTENDEYFRLFGKFSSLSKAMKRAKELSKKYNVEIKVM